MDFSASPNSLKIQNLKRCNGFATVVLAEFLFNSRSFEKQKLN